MAWSGMRALEIAECGVASAEVVDGDADAERSKVGQRSLTGLHVLHEGALGDLHVQGVGNQTRPVERLSTHPAAPGVDELTC
jgi:hypothetical protein